MILEFVHYYCSVELGSKLRHSSKFGMSSCPPDKVSLCIPVCPGTHSVDEAGLKLSGLHHHAQLRLIHSYIEQLFPGVISMN